MHFNPAKVISSRSATILLSAILILALSGCPASNPTTPQPPSSTPPSSTPPSGPPSSQSSSGSKDVWQPPSSGGMPGQEQNEGQSGSQPTADSESGETDIESADGSADGGFETAAGMPGSSNDDLLDMSLEDFEESMEDAAEDAAQTGSGTLSGASEEQGENGESGGTMTTAEQVAILDSQLERSTGQFDDLILSERDVLSRTAKNRESEANGGEEPASTGGYSDYGEAPPMRGSGGGQGGAGPIPRDQSPGGEFPAQAAVYPPPEDIPHGDDDDVVARQLREAAMREADPVLREKLWNDYRNYKGIEK